MMVFTKIEDLSDLKISERKKRKFIAKLIRDVKKEFSVNKIIKAAYNKVRFDCSSVDIDELAKLIEFINKKELEFIYKQKFEAIDFSKITAINIIKDDDEHHSYDADVEIDGKLWIGCSGSDIEKLPISICWQVKAREQEFQNWAHANIKCEMVQKKLEEAGFKNNLNFIKDLL